MYMSTALYLAHNSSSKYTRYRHIISYRHTPFDPSINLLMEGLEYRHKFAISITTLFAERTLPTAVVCIREAIHKIENSKVRSTACRFRGIGSVIAEGRGGSRGAEPGRGESAYLVLYCVRSCRVVSDCIGSRRLVWGLVMSCPFHVVSYCAISMANPSISLSLPLPLPPSPSLSLSL